MAGYRTILLDKAILYVHYTFMSDAPATVRPNPTDPSPARANDGSPTGRVLVLVRALIVYGQQLLDGLRQPHPDPMLAIGFGPITLASIIARVLRALRIAAALEERLLRPERKREAAADTPSPRTPSVRKPREAGRKAARWDDDDRMPTAEQIAAMLRGRPVGSVLVDICRDLGIGPRHPLWRDLRYAIMDTGGDVTKLVMGMIRRHTSGMFREPFTCKALSVDLDWRSLSSGATGPPGLRPAF